MRRVEETPRAPVERLGRQEIAAPRSPAGLGVKPPLMVKTKRILPAVHPHRPSPAGWVPSHAFAERVGAARAGEGFPAPSLSFAPLAGLVRRLAAGGRKNPDTDQ
jgi:hypothetical protein